MSAVDLRSVISDPTQQNVQAYEKQERSTLDRLSSGGPLGEKGETYKTALDQLAALRQEVFAPGQNAGTTKLAAADVERLTKATADVGTAGTLALREKMNTDSSFTPGTSAEKGKPSNPIKFENGELSVEGTPANEDVVLRQVDDKYKVEYARRDGDKVVERASLEVPAADVKKVTLWGGDGDDRIWNGTGQAKGIPGAEIEVGEGTPQVVNHGDDAKIFAANSNRAFVDNFGANATIVGSEKDPGLYANNGFHSDVSAGLGGTVNNLADDTSLIGAGFNEFNSDANRVHVDAQQGKDGKPARPDKLNITDSKPSLVTDDSQFQVAAKLLGLSTPFASTDPLNFKKNSAKFPIPQAPYVAEVKLPQDSRLAAVNSPVPKDISKK